MGSMVMTKTPRPRLSEGDMHAKEGRLKMKGVPHEGFSGNGKACERVLPDGGGAEGPR